MSKLLEGLKKLDTANDNHWTADGLPRLDTVKFLSGVADVTREMIGELVPGFTRSTATTVLAGATAAPASAVTTPKAKAAQNTPLPASGTLEEAEAELAAAMEVKTKADAVYQAALDKVDAILVATGKDVVTSSSIEVTLSYIESQNELRRKLAEAGGIPDVQVRHRRRI